MMVSHTRNAALAAAAAALIAGALALWLSAAGPGRAALAQQVQGTAVTVAEKAITWSSSAACVPDMGTADFGSVLPGATAQSSPFKGCVTSSAAGWGVTASATDLGGDANVVPIPKGNLRIRTTGTSGSAPPAVGLPCQTPTWTCALDTTQTLLSGGTAGTGGFTYDYSLAVPADAAGGAYSGTVTFTASN